jgi:hypothetical protein
MNRYNRHGDCFVEHENDPYDPYDQYDLYDLLQ